MRSRSYQLITRFLTGRHPFSGRAYLDEPFGPHRSTNRALRYSSVKTRRHGIKDWARPTWRYQLSLSLNSGSAEGRPSRGAQSRWDPASAGDQDSIFLKATHVWNNLVLQSTTKFVSCERGIETMIGKVCFKWRRIVVYGGYLLLHVCGE